MNRMDEWYAFDLAEARRERVRADQKEETEDYHGPCGYPGCNGHGTHDEP